MMNAIKNAKNPVRAAIGYLKILNEVKKNYTRLNIIQEKFFKRQTNQEKVQ